MASFGIEGIRHFSHARAAGVDAEDLSYVFNNCNGMDNALRNAGHSRVLFRRNRLLKSTLTIRPKAVSITSTLITLTSFLSAHTATIGMAMRSWLTM